MEKDRRHRPLLAGIKINTNHGEGTLTGLARRTSNNQQVLVTNLHVMAGSADFSHRC